MTLECIALLPSRSNNITLIQMQTKTEAKMNTSCNIYKYNVIMWVQSV